MRREILDLQRKLKLTTIFVTHDQEEANTTSDRIAVLDQGIIQQVGAPIQLYDEPANRFVADFLGTANLLDGRIEKGTFMADDGTSFPLPGNQGNEGPATAMVRPQDLIIRDRDANEAGGTVLSGEVRHREFLGNLIRYAVGVGDNVILVDESHSAGRRTFAVGDQVALSLNAEQVRILTE